MELIIFGIRDLRNAQMCHSCSSILFKGKTHEPQKPSIHARHTSEMLKEQTLGVLGLTIDSGEATLKIHENLTFMRIIRLVLTKLVALKFLS